MPKPTNRSPERQSPRDIARSISERDAVDRKKLKRESRRAVDAAEKLLKEMDEVFKNLDRKP